MTGIIDYNAGNLKSVERALSFIGAPYFLSKDPAEFAKADRVIFPGDGDAAYAMRELKKSGFDVFLKDWAQAGKPLMGICIGAQIVFDWSEEGDTECLGLIPGTIVHFGHLAGGGTQKVPHMGWNDVTFCNGGTPLCDGVASGTDFYFVHSYVIQPKDQSIIKGYAEYGTVVPSVIAHDNITVFQFHPEKSGTPGLTILRNFTAEPQAGQKAHGGITC